MGKLKQELGYFHQSYSPTCVHCYSVVVLKKIVCDSDRVTPNLKIRDVVTLCGRYYNFTFYEEQDDIHNESDGTGSSEDHYGIYHFDEFIK